MQKSLPIIATAYQDEPLKGRMGRLRLVGSLKLQVSFAEYRLFYRVLLQKRPVILFFPSSQTKLIMGAKKLAIRQLVRGRTS